PAGHRVVLAWDGGVGEALDVEGRIVVVRAPLNTESRGRPAVGRQDHVEAAGPIAEVGGTASRGRADGRVGGRAGDRRGVDPGAGQLAGRVGQELGPGQAGAEVL